MKPPFNFTRFLPMAARLLGRGRLPTLLFAVAAKGSSQGNRLGKLKDDLKLLQALCLAYWRGEYRAISPKALISVVAGLMYFLSPIDAIPDFIPMFGMLNDIAVVLASVLVAVVVEVGEVGEQQHDEHDQRDKQHDDL